MNFTILKNALNPFCRYIITYDLLESNTNSEVKTILCKPYLSLQALNGLNLITIMSKTNLNFINVKYFRMFRLRHDSRLQIFLNATGLHPMPKYFQWTYLVWEMQTRILSLKLLDLSNPIIVICSSLLEWTIQRKSFLIYELEKILEQEVEFDTKIKDSPILLNPIDEMNPNRRWFQTITMSFTGIFDANFDRRDAEILKVIQEGKASLMLDPFFALIMNASENRSRTNMMFSYNEAWQLTIRYIMQRKDHLIDSKSPEIIVLKNDPLRFAFKVNSLHKDQLGKLVRSQLYLPAPKIPNSYPIWRRPSFYKSAIGKKIPMVDSTYQLFNNPLRTHMSNQPITSTYTRSTRTDDKAPNRIQSLSPCAATHRPRATQLPVFNPSRQVVTTRLPGNLLTPPQNSKPIEYQATDPLAADVHNRKESDLAKNPNQLETQIIHFQPGNVSTREITNKVQTNNRESK